MNNFLSYVLFSSNKCFTIDKFCSEICISSQTYYAIQSERRQVSPLVRRSVVLFILQNDVFICDEYLSRYFDSNITL